MSRITAIVCDTGSSLLQLRSSLQCIHFQRRVPDRVIVGFSKADPAKLELVTAFGFDTKLIHTPWWQWIGEIAHESPEVQIAVMKAGQYWPVQRLATLASSGDNIVRSACGYLFGGLGADRALHASVPDPDPSENEDQDFLRVASTVLARGSDFPRSNRILGGAVVDRWRLRRWCSAIRARRADTAARSGAVYFEHSAAISKMEAEQFAASAILTEFRDRHRGRRAFVIGNGPSLAGMDLEPLTNEITFAANAIFLLFHRMSFRPSYYACVDSVVLPDRMDDINRMLGENRGMTGFFPKTISDHDVPSLSWWVPSMIGYTRNVCFFESRPTHLDREPQQSFSIRPWEYLREGRTVTIVLLQLAFLMGCNPIYLIGCDTHYEVPKDTVQLDDFMARLDPRYISVGDDPNHFDPHYFGPGRVWHRPNSDLMIAHYRAVRSVLDPLGVRILNATIGGRLEVFPRVDYLSVVAQTRRPQPCP